MSGQPPTKPDSEKPWEEHGNPEGRTRDPEHRTDPPPVEPPAKPGYAEEPQSPPPQQPGHPAPGHEPEEPNQPPAPQKRDDE